jgi:Rieske Fe-S protein
MSTPAPSSTPDENVRDRRSVLRGAAVVGLAGVATPLIAACGGNDEASGGVRGDNSSAPSSAPLSSAPESSAPASTGGGAGVLGPASEVPVGGGKVFADAKIVVTQPTAGQFKGFTAVCTHNGCLVASVEGGTIICPCHGSKFKIADGSVANGPASSPLAAVAVTVQGGQLHGSA